MTRSEHLQWAKDRALAYLGDGDTANALASMMSDLGKHPDLGCQPALAAMGMTAAMSGDRAAMRRWIEGFI